MTGLTDVRIDYLSHPVDCTEGAMLRQGVPRVKRQILTYVIIIRRIEFLLGDENGRNLVEWSN